MPLVRAVKGIRPLYFAEGVLYCSRYNELLITRDFGQTFEAAGTFPVYGRVGKIAGLHPLLQRIARQHVYRLRTGPNGALVFTMPPGLYSKAAGEAQFRVFSGANGRRPTSLAATPEGRWVFGEYPPNLDRSLDIRVFGSDDSGATWRVLHVFPKGSIRHIHGITHDPYERCFWVCTGDLPHESIVFRASEDFTKLTPVLSGSAMTRFFWIHADANYLVMASDSPNYLNHIFVHNKATGETRQVQAIQNSSFFVGLSGERLFISTNAEPPEDAVVEHVNDRRNAFVWTARPPYTEWRQVLEFPTDFFQRLEGLPRVPSGLFQFSTINFPEGENPSQYLVAYGLGVRGYDDTMLVYDVSQLGK
jgi:hypothetical protein